ncbi:MAG: replication-associated recombination protein A [Candidatus Paracaedibacteraceae bacterium]|nr:replication-associated recombination protein A [Candidatus Paracaedibacteraceae bacterium]
MCFYKLVKRSSIILTKSLFEANTEKLRPLADKMRPKSLNGVVGQEHILSEGTTFFRYLSAKKLPSIILWGPPGCGKTTLSRLLAQEIEYAFDSISAVTSGIVDLRKAFDTAKEKKAIGKKTLLFVDEIHRFNRSQQDVFLAPIEDGLITLVGATTANPSFELNAALLSRCQVLVLKRLTETHLEFLLAKAEAHEKKTLPLNKEARLALINLADGDGRALLNFAESLFLYPSTELLTPKDLIDAVQRRMPAYDKAQEGHYNLISALHKSIRGSDPDAALYWFYRMIDGGEDPLFIARRLVRTATEDIGLADPQALVQALAAKDAYIFLGSPEGELALAQCIVYLATTLKSNAVYVAQNEAMQAAKRSGSLPPPKHILNAPTTLMKQLDYGKEYIYDHNTEEGFSGQNYFPEKIQQTKFYRPKGRGVEKEILSRLNYWEKLRNKY